MPDHTKVSMESFVYELRMDLPRLYREHPTGISMNALHEEYGESIPRILRATQILEEKGVITIGQAENKVHFILPANKQLLPPIPYSTLTPLQRSLFQLLVKSALNNRVRTNYTQLARILKCSQGGVRSSIDRLEHLHYLSLVEPVQPGKPSLVLQLNPEKIVVNPN